MTGTVMHMPTGRLIHENEDAACVETKMKFEKPVLDISAPDGRSVFSTRKLVEETDRQSESEQRAA